LVTSFSEKLLKIVATRCHILRRKCTKFYFGWGSAPDLARGAYSAPPDPVAGIHGPTYKGKEGKGRGKEGKGRVKGEEERERRGEGWEERRGEDATPPSQTKILSTPLR